MMPKILALLFSLLFFLHSLANTFIVTTNADAGTGSLRDALNKANLNGTAAIDTIQFNLPDTSGIGRRIVIESQLPLFTSNIVLDASSQPGSKYGLSDAKVELYVFYSAGPAQKLISILNCNNIQIYGLKINNKIVPTTYNPYNYCIYVENSKNIQLGDVGKGNVITNWTYAIFITNPFDHPELINQNINIYSNFLGLNEDGETPEYNEESIVVKSIQNINIGNLDSKRGNVIACSRERVEIYASTGSVLIANNKIGSNYSGTKALSLPNQVSSHYYDNIFISNSVFYFDIEYVTDIKIINNLSTGTMRSGIYILGYGKKFYIQGNKIGTDITGTKQLSQILDYGIRIENCRSGIIGVENNEQVEKNIIAFAKQGSSSETYLAGTGVAVINCAYGITISRNSIFCDQKWGIGIGNGGAYNIPLAAVNNITPTSISGKAPPLSKIELFRDDSCINCEGKFFFDTTYADANGHWEKNNLDTKDLVVTATDTVRMTSEFSAGKALLTGLRIKNATCGQKNGSIIGLQILSGTWWHWEDANGTIVSYDTTLINIGVGKYRLIIGIGTNSCTTTTDYYTVLSTNLPDSIVPTITSSSCGLNNGSIYSNYDGYSFKGKWLNSLNDSVGTGSTLNKILPGTYYLKLQVLTDTTCSKIYGPFIVKNLSGASLNTNNIKINATTCNDKSGSITGITALNVIGNATIQWVDSLNKVVGNNYDLINIVAGKYRLKFKDAGGCDTIITSFYIIPNNGEIIIDTSSEIISPSKCSGIGGSIQKINVYGGNNFKWVNTATNAIVATTLDVFNLPSGSYQLTVSNSYGCSKNTSVILVPQAVFMPIHVIALNAKDAYCAQSNGFVNNLKFDVDTSSYSFRWIDSASAQVVGKGSSIYNLGAGTYQLFAKDKNDCEMLVYTAHIQLFPIPTFDYFQTQEKDDECNLHVASISGLKLNNLVGPTVYTWYDQNNNIVSNNLNLQNAKAGVYTLKIIDNGICNVQSKPFQIINTDVALGSPKYDNVIVPRFSSASLLLKNTVQANYYLYADVNGSVVLQTNTTGNFIIANITTDTSFYIKAIAGTCSSPITKVDVKVVDKSYFAIPTAFTPNGDGLNDQLLVKTVGYISLTYFRIYDKWGTLMYETQRLNDGWNGTYKGILQNTNAFVWVAQGNDINGKTITDKGTFILMR